MHSSHARQSITYLRRRELMVLNSLVQGLKILKPVELAPSPSLSAPERQVKQKRRGTDIQKKKRASEHLSRRVPGNW